MTDDQKALLAIRDAAEKAFWENQDQTREHQLAQEFMAADRKARAAFGGRIPKT